MKIGFHTLVNGLRMVHAQVPDTQMTALDITYDVGARNEDPDHTGWAHLLEHLMFEGTPRIPDYDARVQMACGEDNAFTNNDFTSFYITVPSVNSETAFMLEADRMAGITLDERSVQIQKQVVIEEFKQRDLGQPYGDIQHLIRPLAYRVHPYRWPTIGITPEHIERATPEAIRTFYNTWYRPSNAVLAVTGALSFEEAVTLTEKYFGVLKDPVDRPCSPLPIEPVQQRQRRKTVVRDVPMDMLVMAFHMGDRNSKDFYACDVITDLLSNGHSSRLNQRLVKEQKMFNSIDAYISGSADPGLLQIAGRLNPGVTLPDAEAAVWTELDKLKRIPVEIAELDKVRNRHESEQVFGQISYLNTAISLAQLTLFDTTPEQEIARYRAVSAEEVLFTARHILTKKNSSVLWYRARAKAGCAGNDRVIEFGLKG